MLGVGKKLLLFSVPLSMTLISTVAIDAVGRYFIHGMLGSAAVGGFAAGYDLAQQSMGAIMNVFFLAYYPKMVAKYEAGPEEAKESLPGLLKALQTDLFFYGAIQFCILYSAATEICAILLGKEIAPSASSIIGYVSLGVLLNCMKAFYFDVAFMLEKKTWISLFIMASMVVFSVVFNYALISIFGVSGAGFTLVLTFGFGVILSWFMGRKIIKFPNSMPDILRNLTLTLIACTICAFVSEDRVWLALAMKISAVCAVFGSYFIYARWKRSLPRAG
ncbi:hypothetical protein YWS52_27250 [Chitiniphilus shinanonensis]